MKVSVSAFRKEVAELMNTTESSDLTKIMQRTLNRLYTEYLNLESEIEAYDQELAALFKQSPECQRLSTIPGVGLFSALAIKALIGDIHHFRNARHLSAYLGLVPQQRSSGGRSKLLGMSKRGNSYVRTLLIHGARSVLWRVNQKEDKRSQWLKSLVGRCGFNKACVALANKQARTIWAILTREEVYQENHQPRWGSDHLTQGCAHS
jgi:transposase